VKSCLFFIFTYLFTIILPAQKADSLLLQEARRLVNKAYECKREKKWEDILTYSLPAAEMLIKINDPYTRARCATVTGYSYFYSTKYAEAIKYFSDAVEYWNETKNDSAAIYIDLMISGCLMETGNYTLALEKEFKSLNASIRIGNKFLEALSNQSASNTYMTLKKYKEAKPFLENAIRINEAIKDTLKLAQNQSTVASILIEEKKFAEAENYITASLKNQGSAGSPPGGIQWCYGLFGLLNERRGDSCILKNNKKKALLYFKDAFNYYTKSVRICEDNNYIILIIEKYIYLGSVCRKLQNYGLSKKYLMDAIPLSKEYGVKDLTAAAHLELSTLDSTMGNFEGAFENSKQYKLYSDSLSLEIDKGKTESFAVQAEIEKREEEIKLLASENKLKTALAGKQKQQKVFAYAGIAVVILLSGYGFYRYRINKKTEMQQVQLKDRLQISQGLHDDIGSTLSSISVYSQVAKKLSEKDQKEEMNEMLGKITDASKEMVSEMNDIVWAINPKNDSMDRILQRMESFSTPLTSARNIHFELQYDKSVLSLQLKMEKKKNFYLVFKEAINNAIKYSGASELRAVVKSDNDLLKLIIQDNGVGFNAAKEMSDNNTTLSGQGLKNMHQRAIELGGDLFIESKLGSGTIITLAVPVG